MQGKYFAVIRGEYFCGMMDFCRKTMGDYRPFSKIIRRL
nr:MAG TPA: hypothetical protein [Caudoviricetes sp.]